MSAPPTMPEAQGTSTRPYLIRALHDWCTDNGFTPYLAVYVDRSVQVPIEYVKDNEIVLNASFEATSGLQLGNDLITFKARFGGAAREIVVPVDHVIAIYARENGQGMAFPAPADAPPAGMAPIGDANADAPVGAAPRGLRLATPPGESPQEPETTQSMPPAPLAQPSADSPDEPNPPEPGGGRPALKRIK